MSAATDHRRFNLPLFVAIAIPALAVVASLATVAVAVLKGDRKLPEQYHWEGFRLDRDFARFERAVALNVRGTLQVSADHVCRVHLALSGDLPEALELSLVHATMPALDRRVRLIRRGDFYEQACEARPPGSWRIEIGDPDGEWGLRQHAQGTLERMAFEARPPSASLGDDRSAP